MIHEATKKFSWDAVEVEHAPKSADWYWALGIAAVAGIVLSILGHNYLLAILLALGAIMIGWHANDVPGTVHVEISERGVKLDRDLYPYELIKSFWMFTDHKGRNRILFVTGRAVMPERVLTLSPDVSANDLREYLMDFIEERETYPSAITTLAENLGL